MRKKAVWAWQHLLGEELRFTGEMDTNHPHRPRELLLLPSLFPHALTTRFKRIQMIITRIPNLMIFPFI